MIIKIIVIVSYVVLLIILAAFIRFDMHDFTIKAIGAFTGAFFAFIFIRTGEVLTKLFERQRTHYAAMVKLEHIYNGYLNDISGNIFEIGEISKIKQHTNGQPPTLSYNRLETFVVNDDILLDLADIALINKLASFNFDLRKMNSSIDAANRLYDEIREAAIHHLITRDSYVQNFDSYVVKLRTAKAFLESLNDKSKRNLAMVRLLSKRKPAFNKLFGAIFSARQLMPLDKEIDAELKRMEDEVTEIRRKSREEINKICETSQKSVTTGQV